MKYTCYERRQRKWEVGEVVELHNRGATRHDCCGSSELLLPKLNSAVALGANKK